MACAVADYAPLPPLHRRKRFRRIALLLLVLILAGLAWWAHRPVVNHIQLMYWQHRCATYTLPPQTVVASTGAPGKLTAAPVPTFWTAYARDLFRWTVLVASPKPNTLAFLHEVRTRGGRQRIVVVQCFPLYLSSASIIQGFRAVALQPAAWWPLNSGPRIVDRTDYGGFPIPRRVQVFAGQIDPQNSSHFTIAYTMEDKPGVIDGYLADDDSISLKVRPGSADVMHFQ